MEILACVMFLLTLTTSLISADSCDGIVGSNNKFSYKSHCYTLNDTASAYADADRVCDELPNGYLVIFSSYAELKAVQTGLTGMKTINKLRWVNALKNAGAEEGLYFMGTDGKAYGPWPTKSQGWRLEHSESPNNPPGAMCMVHVQKSTTAVIGFDDAACANNGVGIGVICEYESSTEQSYRVLEEAVNTRMIALTTIVEYNGFSRFQCALMCGKTGNVAPVSEPQSRFLRFPLRNLCMDMGFSYNKDTKHCVIHLTDYTMSDQLIQEAPGYKWYEER